MSISIIFIIVLCINYKKGQFLYKDKLYTGGKELIDACVMEGLIYDDNPDCVDLKVEQYKANEYHTMIIRKKRS